MGVRWWSSDGEWVVAVLRWGLRGGGCVVARKVRGVLRCCDGVCEVGWVSVRVLVGCCVGDGVVGRAFGVLESGLQGMFWESFEGLQ